MIISVSVNITEAQEAKLERIRLLRNGQGEDFADITDMAKKFMIRSLQAEQVALDLLDAAALEASYVSAFRNSTPEVKAQIRALLGV